MSLAQHSTPELTWHRVPDPDDEPDTNRILSWGKVPVGYELTGSYRGTLDGKFGPIGVVELEDGASQRFGVPTLLARRLSVVERGQQIKIVYLGLKDGKNTSYHTFDVYSAVLATEEGPPDESDDGEVPF